MRWVLVALLLLAPTAVAANAHFGSAVGNPALFAPQMACFVLLTTSTFDDCRWNGALRSATIARIVLDEGVTAHFRVDDGTSQPGQGTCSTRTCAIPFSYAASSQNAFVTFKVWGPHAGWAFIEIAREQI